MSNYTMSAARSVSSAWEAMENEYDTIQFNAARAGLFKSDIEADTEVRTRKGKLNRQTSFTTKLSDEQVEMLEDWHDLTSLAEAGYCSAPAHLKLVDEQGRKLLFHHWNKGDKASRSLRRAWKWADHVICCHSATLPSDVRCKAAVLKGGPVHGIGVITPWYNEPVINEAQAKFIVEERHANSLAELFWEAPDKSVVQKQAHSLRELQRPGKDYTPPQGIVSNVAFFA